MDIEQTGSLKAWVGARIAVLSPTPTHPQDYGNRKRIFRVCSRYAEEGARITFIHYPAELEWRAQIPWAAERAMNAAWAQHFTIAPTRQLHTDPKGNHHAIDEWWDRSIGDFLTWLFSVQSFDVFIVNYSWLSKALEFAPRSTFKILDTQDKFSGRREMLESLGLTPEFFYTTEAQEKIALDRADLVWAIKREEAAQLARLTPSPVLALPHLDPLRPLPPPAPDAQGYLRVGVIGARNNVNRMNITEFLGVAEPIFREAFAPVKIVIAGSVCGLLEFSGGPFVELRGPVEDVADFYASVDCVAIPMRTSTGLKIKTGEALSLGLPVISLAHAFEGYEPQDRLHSLSDFTDMARALVELSFAPRTRLDSLRQASLRAHERTSALVAGAYRHSDALATGRRRLIVLAVDSRAFVPGSIFNLVLRSMHDYLRGPATVTVLVVRGRACDVAANAGAVDRFRRVVVADDLEGAAGLAGELSKMGVDVFDAREFLIHAHPTVVIADALHPALAGINLPDTVAISRVEMIAASEGHAAFALLGEGFCRAFVATPAMSPEIAARAAAIGAEVMAAPCFWRSHEFGFPRAKDMRGVCSVALLAEGDTPGVRMAAAMARAWGLESHVVCGVGGESGIAADAYVASIVQGSRPPPNFAVDLSGAALGLPLCREVLERLHVPVVTTAAVAFHGSLDFAHKPLHAATEAQLWSAFRSMALDSHADHAQTLKLAWADLESDGGWAWLWRYCRKLFEDSAAQFA